MKRVLVGGFHHESNSLSSIISEDKDFRILRGTEITDTITPNNALSGIVSTLKEAGVEVVPTLHMRGVPNGEISQEFFTAIRDEFLAMARKEIGAIDAITLALHGSMRVRGIGEAEGHILEKLRAFFPNTPIFVALDMHTTMSKKMCTFADGFVGYKTAPHIDCTETGKQAAEMTLYTLNTGKLPKKSTIRIPMILAGEKSGTDVEPMKSLIEKLVRTEQDDEVLAASYLLGFPWSDNADSSVSIHLVTKTSQKRSDQLACELAQLFWEKRNDFIFVTETHNICEAIRRASAYVKEGHKPVYLSDSGDNPTAGAESDNTQLLHELLENPNFSSFDVIYGGFYDPAAVNICGQSVGKNVTLSIGGNFDQRFSPISVEAVVTKFIPDYVYAGLCGAVAAIRIKNLQIILSEKHIGYTDPALMRALELEPKYADIVICKLGYLTPGHAAIAKKSILVLTEGSTNEDIESIPYRNVPRPIFPLDRNIRFHPEDPVYSLESSSFSK